MNISEILEESFFEMIADSNLSEAFESQEQIEVNQIAFLSDDKEILIVPKIETVEAPILFGINKLTSFFDGSEFECDYVSMSVFVKGPDNVITCGSLEEYIRATPDYDSINFNMIKLDSKT